jgi:hypothetical protein
VALRNTTIRAESGSLTVAQNITAGPTDAVRHGSLNSAASRVSPATTATPR